MLSQIYSAEFQLNKANSGNTEAPFWMLSCQNQMSKIHPKFMMEAEPLCCVVDKLIAL